MASGRHRAYDALVLCLGARAGAARPGAITFHDGRVTARVRGAVDDVLRRRARAPAFAAPAGRAWTLPSMSSRWSALAACSRRAWRRR